MEDDPYGEIKALVHSAGSRIFTIVFFKADRTLRTMKVQQAVAKFHLTPREELTEAGAKANETKKERYPNLMNLWDIENEGFRAVNLNAVTEIHIDGKTFHVEGLKPVEQPKD